MAAWLGAGGLGIGRGTRLARGPEGGRHGRRVGVEPELDPGSVGGARRVMTGGVRPSAFAVGRARTLGLAGP
jgi:hypothetical protein